LTGGADDGTVPDHRHPEDLVAAIVALADQTTANAFSSARATAQADALGRGADLLEQVCRLAVGAGVATGEVSWLVGEFESADPTRRQLDAAGAAIAGMQSSLLSVAFAVRSIDDPGGRGELVAAAEALSRSAFQLEDLRLRLQPEPALGRS
jgi:hypothetical protein